MVERSKYPKRVVCGLTGIVAVVWDASEERRFHIGPMLALGVSLIVAFLLGLAFLIETS